MQIRGHLPRDREEDSAMHLLPVNGCQAEVTQLYPNDVDTVTVEDDRT